MGRTVTLVEAFEVVRRCSVKCGQGVQCTNISDFFVPGRTVVC